MLISHSSSEANTLIPPQEWLDRKSTGLVALGCAGYLSRKSSSAALISLLIRSICNSKQDISEQPGHRAATYSNRLFTRLKCVAKKSTVPHVGGV